MLTCYNWALSDAVASPVLSVDMFWTTIRVKILHKCDETSLTVTHIAVSLKLSEKRPQRILNGTLSGLLCNLFRFHKETVPALQLAFAQ